MMSPICLERKLLVYPNSRLDEILIIGQRFCSNIFKTKQLMGSFLLMVGILAQSYVLANTIVFLPFLLIVGILFGSPVYWLVRLRRDNIDGFLSFTPVVWMVLLMSNSFVACFSALVPNFIMGNSVIAGSMGSFFMFSGYFIAKDEIPYYWVFMHYLSLCKYTFECFMINEFGGKQGQRKCLEFENGECSLYGNWFLRQQDLKDSQKWTNLAVMLAFVIGYRLLCLFILWFRCYRARN